MPRKISKKVSKSSGRSQSRRRRSKRLQTVKSRHNYLTETPYTEQGDGENESDTDDAIFAYSRKPLSVSINFDAASKAWRANKKAHAETKSTYYYLCSAKKCKRKAYVSKRGVGFGRHGFCEKHWLEMKL